MVEVKLSEVKQHTNSLIGSHQEQAWPTKPEGYNLECVIGIGSFGIVWKATCQEGSHAGKEVAVKIIDLNQFEEASLQDLRKESAIMNTSRHKNMVHELVSFTSAGNFLWIIMQLIDAGSCTDLIHNLRRVKQELVGF